MVIFFTPTLSNIAKKENDVKEFCMWFANFYIFGWNWSRIGLRSRLLILAPDYYSKNCQIDWLRETLISPFWFSPKVKFSSFSSFYLFNNCSQGLMLWFTLFLNRSFYHTKQCVDPCSDQRRIIAQRDGCFCCIRHTAFKSPGLRKQSMLNKARQQHVSILSHQLYK